MISRGTAALLLASVGVAASLALAGTSSPRDPGPLSPSSTTTIDYRPLYLREHGLRLRAERRLARSRRTASRLERLAAHQRLLLLNSATVAEAIGLACAVYGRCTRLWRRARCESSLHWWARHSAAADSPLGLFQFRPSTFRGTPFARLPILSPYANALAAGWMDVQGRGGEFACA